MRKLLLVISLVVPLLFSSINVSTARADDEIINEECNSESSIVRIVNNYNDFKGNGFVYKVDNNYSYVVTSSKIINNVHSYSVIYEDNSYKKAILLGIDENNEVAVFKVEKTNDVKGVCLSNSNYLYKGQRNYLYGYIDINESFIRKATLVQIGDLYSDSNYMNIFKNGIQVEYTDKLEGVAVFDELNRLVGLINGYNERMTGVSYIVESNKLIKIADSIVKTGNYSVNYIKYSLVDYSLLSSRLRESYGVHSSVNSGVVVTSFKPLNFVFGGLNQGMTIVAVNGIEVNSVYELDKQFSRYDKKSDVCLKVIKKNGRESFYYVTI